MVRQSVARRVVVVMGAFVLLGIPVNIVAAAMTGLVAFGPVSETVSTLLFFASLAVLVVAGMVIAWHRPRNPIGWIYLAEAVMLSVVPLGESGAATATGWGLWALWGSQLHTFTLSLAATVPLLIFPEGRALSRRWRWVVVAAYVNAGLLTIGVLFAPVMGEFNDIPNPAALPGRLGDLAFSAATIGWMGLLLLVGLAAVSAVLRFRRSKGLERQQLRWIAFGGAVMVAGYVSAIFLSNLSEDWWSLSIAGVVAVPAASAIAISRYRLYDLDRVVSRTVTYIVVLIVLGAVYASGVVGVQSLLPASGDLVVAGSTLATAALFTPVRRGVLAWVERRFNRARYDAKREVESFAGRLRSAVDLTQVTGELRSVITRTVQPASTWVWIRPAANEVGDSVMTAGNLTVTRSSRAVEGRAL